MRHNDLYKEEFQNIFGNQFTEECESMAKAIRGEEIVPITLVLAVAIKKVMDEVRQAREP